MAEQKREVRYYDTLKNSSLFCLSVAHTILDLLTAGSFRAFENDELLPVRNKKRQSGLTCGIRILHCIEEEVRFYLGERRGTVEPDLPH